MKNLIIMSVLLVATVSWANGIERYSDDSKKANRVSWKQILGGKKNLKVDKSSVINPKGANLFNVCVYDDNHFRVINPKSKCVKYKERIVNVPRSGGKTKVERTCVKREAVDFQLVASSYSKCIEAKSEVLNPDAPRRDQYSRTTCVKSEVSPIPYAQKADVYTQRREELYQFSKTYVVPMCDSLGGDLPDTDIPGDK